MNEKIQTQVWLPEIMKTKLEALAKATDKSQQYHMQEAIATYLVKYENTIGLGLQMLATEKEMREKGIG